MTADIKKPSSAAKFRAVLPALVLLPSVSLVLSFVMTWATVGFGPEFAARWGRSFISALVVLPFALAVVGLLEKQLDKVLGSLPVVARKLVAAAFTACVIETVIAAAITLSSGATGSSFVKAWWVAFSNSLPAGAVIGLFMGFYMKPKLEQLRQRALAG